MAMASRELTVADTDAKEIGALYSRARSSFVESVRCLTETGKRLKAKKASLPQGAWLPWLTDNADVLGFGERAARMLMKGASNRKLAADLGTEEALQISRELWGHGRVLEPPARRTVMPYRADDGTWMFLCDHGVAQVAPCQCGAPLEVRDIEADKNEFLAIVQRHDGYLDELSDQCTMVCDRYNLTDAEFGAWINRDESWVRQLKEKTLPEFLLRKR
jgi:hypothetical protein